MTNEEVRKNSEIRNHNPVRHRLWNSSFRVCFHSSFEFLASLLILTLLELGGSFCFAQTLTLPPRPANAPGASRLLAEVASFDLRQREERLALEILGGNVPNFLRLLHPIHATNNISGTTTDLTFFVTPDYLAVGSDDDYFLAPLSPYTAQRIAEAFNCSLPTPKIVDLIYQEARVKLAPTPIAAGAEMTTVPVFSNHNFMVSQQRRALLGEHPLGELVAGHKKDVVISTRLTNSPGKVAIYGWHRLNGKPIQPLYLGHTCLWVDYSQCIRLVQQVAFLNGKQTTVDSILGDSKLAGFITDEGPLKLTRYPTNFPAASALPSSSGHSNASVQANGFSGFQSTGAFGEEIASFTIEPDVKVQINRETAKSTARKPNRLLVIYALPNGNTIAQTAGHRIKPGEDWHFDIQHIAAQTRFLRRLQPELNMMVAYLESGPKSWPAWRKAHGDQLLPRILAEVRRIAGADGAEIALTSHSGGGSLIFGYLNAIEKIPDEVVRIAFLDSNYAYESTLAHDSKIADWLYASQDHYLCVLAYDDANALLEGKPFVSAAGGTWGRSHAMQADLAKSFAFQTQTNSGLETYSGLNGRVQFLLKQNPERKVLHTVQVERNGFIHSLLSGTDLQNNGYDYFGERAYSGFIDEK